MDTFAGGEGGEIPEFYPVEEVNTNDNISNREGKAPNRWSSMHGKLSKVLLIASVLLAGMNQANAQNDIAHSSGFASVVLNDTDTVPGIKKIVGMYHTLPVFINDDLTFQFTGGFMGIVDPTERLTKKTIKELNAETGEYETKQIAESQRYNDFSGNGIVGVGGEVPVLKNGYVQFSGGLTLEGMFTQFNKNRSKATDAIGGYAMANIGYKFNSMSVAIHGLLLNTLRGNDISAGVTMSFDELGYYGDGGLDAIYGGAGYAISIGLRDVATTNLGVVLDPEMGELNVSEDVKFYIDALIGQNTETSSRTRRYVVNARTGILGVVYDGSVLSVERRVGIVAEGSNSSIGGLNMTPDVSGRVLASLEGIIDEDTFGNIQAYLQVGGAGLSFSKATGYASLGLQKNF